MTLRLIHTQVRPELLRGNLRPFVRAAADAALRSDVQAYRESGFAAAQRLAEGVHDWPVRLQNPPRVPVSKLIGYESPLQNASVVSAGDWRTVLGLEDAPLQILSGARDALQFALRALCLPVGTPVLLPAVICSSVTGAIRAVGLRPLFYGVREDYSPDLATLRARVTQDVGAALFVNFYDFPCEFDEAVALVRQASPNVRCLYDCAQAMFAANRDMLDSGLWDYCFTSQRKFLGVPDGALLIAGRGDASLREPVVQESSRPSTFVKFVARALRRLAWDNHYGYRADALACDLLDIAEYDLDREQGIFPAAEVSMQLLAETSLESVRRARLDNVAHLISSLSSDSITFRNPGYDPRGLFVLVGRADEARRDAAARGVYLHSYGSTSWALDAQVLRDAALAQVLGPRLSQVRLAIDDCYRREDMGRQVQAIFGGAALEL